MTEYYSTQYCLRVRVSNGGNESIFPTSAAKHNTAVSTYVDENDNYFLKIPNNATNADIREICRFAAFSHWDSNESNALKRQRVAENFLLFGKSCLKAFVNNEVKYDENLFLNDVNNEVVLGSANFTRKSYLHDRDIIDCLLYGNYLPFMYWIYSTTKYFESLTNRKPESLNFFVNEQFCDDNVIQLYLSNQPDHHKIYENNEIYSKKFKKNISKSVCIEWKKNKTTYPFTNRKIKEENAIYKEFKKLCSILADKEKPKK